MQNYINSFEPTLFCVSLKQTKCIQAVDEEGRNGFLAFGIAHKNKGKVTKTTTCKKE